MNKKITRILKNFSRFFDKWKLDELSSQLIKLKEHVFLVFFPKIGGHSKRQCHYTGSYLFFLSKKKKENSRSFLYLTNLLKLKAPGRIQRTERAPFCFHWCAVEEFYGIFLRLLCVRRAQWKWSAAIDCQRPFWTKNYWLRGGGGGWPFIRMKSTWITSILSFLGKEIGEN